MIYISVQCWFVYVCFDRDRPNLINCIIFFVSIFKEWNSADNYLWNFLVSNILFTIILIALIFFFATFYKIKFSHTWKSLIYNSERNQLMKHNSVTWIFDECSSEFFRKAFVCHIDILSLVNICRISYTQYTCKMIH